MHLLERYSLNTGTKIDKPYIHEDYFPMNADRYITFHPIGGPNKDYSHWQEVIDLIYPILKKENIEIIQIGGNEKNQRTFKNTLNVLGQTSHSQLAYLIRRGMLHFGIDSFPMQMAGYYDKNIVSIYSHVLPNNRKPFWGSEEKQILLEPDRGGKKPGYLFGDPLKTVDKISPITIASSICKLLGLNFNHEYETLYIGRSYNINFPDLVPNTMKGGYSIDADRIRIRMDWHFDEEIMAQILNQLSRKSEIVTAKKINLNLLQQLSSKIDAVIIHYDGTNLDEFDEGYFNVLNMLPFNVAFISYEDEEVNKKFKLKYMDSAVLMCQKWPKKEETNLTNINDQIYFKSSRRILSDSKIYHSYYAYKNDLPDNIPQKTILSAVDDELFWRDLPYFNLLKKSN